MNTNEKINNTIEEMKKVFEKHADKEDAKKALVELDQLLEKRIEEQREKE